VVAGFQCSPLVPMALVIGDLWWVIG